MADLAAPRASREASAIAPDGPTPRALEAEAGRRSCHVLGLVAEELAPSSVHRVVGRGGHVVLGGAGNGGVDRRVERRLAVATGLADVLDLARGLHPSHVLDDAGAVDQIVHAEPFVF